MSITTQQNTHQGMKGNIPGTTLEEFTHYHGMFINPWGAKRCIDSFSDGCVLFMPTSYGRDEQTFPSDGKKLSPFHYFVSILTYYGLVIISFTGLSTILGLTTFIEAKESSEPFQDPKFEVDDRMIKYMAKYGSNDSTGIRTVKQVRRFEYKFHIPNIHVVMIHYVNLEKDGSIAKNVNTGKEILHLVEIFELGPPSSIVNGIYEGILTLLGVSLPTKNPDIKKMK